MSTKIQETLTTQIAKIALEDETKLVLKDKFQPFFEQAEKWMDAASTLVVTDASQVNEMKMAREARLALKDIRVNVEKTRKALKEDSLRKSQAIDAIAGTLKGLIEPIENHLEQQEKFVEIQEQRRKQLLKEERIALLAPYEVPTDFYDL